MHNLKLQKPFIYILIAYLISSVLLFLYSYTQVDLNLTLSRVSIWQTIQKSFQYIGFFQRPLSTGIFIAILGMFFILYLIVLVKAKKNLISYKQLWCIIYLLAIILVFTYPAFSYDLFNHMFTAKTVLIYHQNPYLVLPLEFSGIDPWLNFMHWTHVTSVYTPLWIAMTCVPYLLGFGYFLLIMWNFKIMIGLFYLLAVKGIALSLGELNPNKKILGMAIFALNPLVIIESLVSSHNDIVMIGFAMIGIFFLIKKDSVKGLFALALSIATKYVTLLILPFLIFGYRKRTVMATMLAGMFAFLFVFKREILPWYWLWIIPFIALIPEDRAFTIISTGVSIGLLLRYAPFLYFGAWDPPVPLIEAWLTAIPIATAVIIIIIRELVSRRLRAQIHTS